MTLLCESCDGNDSSIDQEIFEQARIKRLYIDCPIDEEDIVQSLVRSGETLRQADRSARAGVQCARRILGGYCAFECKDVAATKMSLEA